MRYLKFVCLLACLASTSVMAECTSEQAFPTWLKDFKAEAVAAGLKPAVFDSALAGMTPDKSVIQRDRSQQTFALDF